MDHFEIARKRLFQSPTPLTEQQTEAVVEASILACLKTGGQGFLWGLVIGSVATAGVVMSFLYLSRPWAVGMATLLLFLGILARAVFRRAHHFVPAKARELAKKILSES